MPDTCEKCGQKITEPASDNETAAVFLSGLYAFSIWALAMLKAMRAIDLSWWWIPIAPLAFGGGLFAVVFVATFLFWKEPPHA